MPCFQRLLITAIVAFCLVTMACWSAAAKDTDPIYLQSPYDEITLDDNNNNAVLKVQPLN